MKKILVLAISAAAFAAACGGGAKPAANSNQSKPAGNSNTAAPNKDASSAPSNKPEKEKTALKGEKKPEGTAKTAKKSVPIPADWIYVYDSNRGYGFSVPDGSTGDSDSSDGVDFMAITTPEPSNIDIFVLAYKNKELTKEDLLDDAVSFLEGLGQKVTPGQLKAESDDYAVADATTELSDGRKGKLRILVGTDVTDNYVMILGCETDKFAANEKIIDEIWGSFEMWSGGASNN